MEEERNSAGISVSELKTDMLEDQFKATAENTDLASTTAEALLSTAVRIRKKGTLDSNICV